MNLDTGDAQITRCPVHGGWTWQARCRLCDRQAAREAAEARSRVSLVAHTQSGRSTGHTEPPARQEPA